jgi:hypothetical protein
VTLSQTLNLHLIQVIHIEIQSLSHIKQTHLDLTTHIDPTDFTSLRFIVTLQNDKGVLCRVKLLPWDECSVVVDSIGTDDIAKVAEGVPLYSVEHMPLGAVQKSLGMNNVNIPSRFPDRISFEPLVVSGHRGNVLKSVSVIINGP